MNLSVFRLFLVISVTAGWADCPACETDVLIYGATPGGIAAAVSAAKGGHNVTLIEPTDRIGGLATCGLSYTDFRSLESLTGFFLDFATRVEGYYAARYGANSAQVKDSFHGTHGEPAVNLLVLEQMLSEFPKLNVIKSRTIESVELSPMTLGRQRIRSATFRSHDNVTNTIAAQVFIDGSYEGDLMAMAGENYHVGRESREQYGESMAGNRQGQADGQVQGYNLRLIMTTVATNKLETPAPEGYDRLDFVDSLAVFASGKLTKVFSSGHDGIYRAHLPLLPNGKTDVNDTPHAPVRLSMPDINDRYPDGDAATRAAIIREHYDYNIGLLYFLQNDDAVPPAIRADARRWGLCKDEFTETNGLPPQLYIREARRMVGQHLFTEDDTRHADGDARAVHHTDSIAIGDYVHNCHGTGRVGSRFDGSHEGEFYKPVSPYQIPYGVIVPSKTENLLVPVACSASHFGFGALRLEPIWSSLGQAAGWAAHVSLQDESNVQDLNVPKLQRQLHVDRSATMYVSDVSPGSTDFAAVQWFALRGGLHGLATDNQPKAKSMGGQYCFAHPGHTIQLDEPLDESLRAKWMKIAQPSEPSTARTRGQWIHAAYEVTGH